MDTCIQMSIDIIQDVQQERFATQEVISWTLTSSCPHPHNVLETVCRAKLLGAQQKSYFQIKCFMKRVCEIVDCEFIERDELHACC